MKYKDIASYIRNKIIDGDWLVGMKIPSHRQLAKKFNVNRTTIIKSIEVLEAEGFIYTAVGSGTFVNDFLDQAYILNKWSEMMEWTSQSRSGYTVQLINKLEADSQFIQMSKGELGRDLLPKNALKEAMIQTSNLLEHIDLGYLDGYGYDALREEIARRLNQKEKHITKDNILITAGALHAIRLLVTGFLSKDAIVFSSNPSYIASTHVLQSENIKNVRFDYNHIEALADDLDKYIGYRNKAIYIDAIFNNPTGLSLSIIDKALILNYSKRFNIPIFEDNIYSDIWFESKPDNAIYSMETHGNIFTIGSFSKTIAPAMRIGWIVAPEKVIEQLADIRMQSDYGSSLLSQLVICEMLKNGSYDNHLAQLRGVLKEKRDYMLQMLKMYFSDIAKWNIPKGGFFIWLVFTIEIDIKKLFSILIEEEQILLNPGFIYGSRERAVRLSFAYESKEQIEVALIKIKKQIEKMRYV